MARSQGEHEGRVERPSKKNEYVVEFATRDAQKGWRDLCSTTGNAMADAWDYLTKTPDASRAPHGPLKGDYATLTRDGNAYQRWQYEVPGGARIWYWIVPSDARKRVQGRVLLERVFTHHPNQTK